MIWKVNGQELPLIRLATLLGIVSGAVAGLIAFLAQAVGITLIAITVLFGLGGFLAVIVIYLTDTTLTAIAEGETRRAHLRAAHRLYTEWAQGTLEPPSELSTAAYKVNGEVKTLAWISDDDPEAAKWRGLLVALFQYARAINRESKGARTGLTEVDLYGDTPTHMFIGRDSYLAAIKVARELELVERVNGLPTRLKAGWTYGKAITYLLTAAVLPPLSAKAPPYRAYRGLR